MGVLIAVACFWAVVIGVFELKRRQPGSRRLVGKRLGAVALALLIAVGSITPVGGGNRVHADGTNVGGIDAGSGSAGGSTPTGAFQTSDHINLLRATFIVSDKGQSVTDGTTDTATPNRLNNSSDRADLALQKKFDVSTLKTSFYMAPNATVDAAIRNSGSGLGYWDDSSKTVKVLNGYGKNVMYGGDTGTAQFEKRLLAYADLSMESNSSAMNDNYFRGMLASALYEMDPGNSKRNLATAQAGQTVGQNIDFFLRQRIMPENQLVRVEFGPGGKKTVITDPMYYQARTQEVLDSYLKLVRSKGLLGANASEYDKLSTDLNKAFEEGRLRLVFQTVPAFYIKGKSPETGPFTFLPFTDAVNMYLTNRSLVRPDMTAGLRFEREAEAVEKGGASSATSGNKYDEKYGYMSYSFRHYAKENYSRTLKPVSKTVKLTTNTSINPFGGWGYQTLPMNQLEAANEPKISAVLNVTVLDKDGNQLKKFETEVPGWEESQDRILSQIDTRTGDIVTIDGEMGVVDPDDSTGKTYEIKPGKAKVTLTDTFTLPGGSHENINKNPLNPAIEGTVFNIDVPAEGSDGWMLGFDFELPNPLKLAKYLGGAKAQNFGDVTPKYTDKTQPTFSNALVRVYVTAVDPTTPPPQPDTDPSSSSLEVPQWRLSKYWPSITPSGNYTDATFFLDVPMETGRDAVLSPSGTTSFRLIDPVLSSIDWAISKAKTAPGGSTTHSITLDNRSALIKEHGDLLAIKSNKDVMNTKFAQWVNDLNFLDRIASTNSGEKGTQAQVTKTFPFAYGVKNNSDVYRYSETRSRYAGESAPDAEGRTHALYEDYPWSGTATSIYQDAVYNASVLFNRFLPKANATPAKFANAESAVNGTYWKTSQESDVLKVDPEVAMAYSDAAGNTNVAMTAGDVLRTMQPVTYNLARYINVGVAPDVNGASVATDAKAKALAASLQSGGKEVIYKGSAITTNFSVKGQIELKTFALDIGQTSLKNAWNAGTTYNTDKLNTDFLNELAEKDASGKWAVKLDTDGNLKLNGKEVGGKSKQLTAKQLAPGTSVNGYTVAPGVVEHKLVIRSGKLFSVDGNTNLDSLDETLKNALSRAKLTGTKTIFNNFQAAAGAGLTESQFAALGNALRGTSDLATGKGWYNEDSTVLVFREYTTTFELPQYMYVDKLPMQIAGLQAPVDKNMFFSKGYKGFTMLQFQDTSKFYMNFDSSQPNGNLAGFFRSEGQVDPNKQSTDYIVPNATVLDTFGSQ